MVWSMAPQPGIPLTGVFTSFQVPTPPSSAGSANTNAAASSGSSTTNDGSASSFGDDTGSVTPYASQTSGSSDWATVITSTVYDPSTDAIGDLVGTPTATITTTSTFGTFSSSTISSSFSTLRASSAASASPKSAPTSVFVSSNKGSTNLSKGAAAGVGIGSAVGGALLALLAAALVCFCCTRRRGRRHLAVESGTGLPHQHIQPDSRAAPPLLAPLPVPALSREKPEGPAVDSPLSPMCDDETLLGTWADIQQRISNHVANYYHYDPVNPTVVADEWLERLGYTRIQPSAAELVERILQPQHRAGALMYLISFCIVQRIDFYGSRWNTLLPPECVESMKAMRGNASPGKAPILALVAQKSPDEMFLLALLTQWRISTAQLLQRTYVKRGFNRDDPRTAYIEAVLKALMPILRPFVLEARVTAAFEDLEDILEESARFGFHLFASPDIYEFDWREGGWYEREELASLPALVKVNERDEIAYTSSSG